MARKYNNSLNGLHPLGYMGVNASQPPQFLTYNRAPTTQDNQNVAIGDEWLDQSVTPADVWKLVSLSGGVATWIMLTGNSGTVTELTGNDGLMATPLLGNINVKGDGTNITVTRSPDTHSLLITPGTNGTPASSFPTGAGVSTTSGTTAVPTAAGILNVLGSHNVLTGGAVANTITVFGTNSITLGDLSAIAADSGAVTCTTGDVIITAGDLRLPNTNTAGNQGIIKFGGNRWISNFGNVNTFVGQNSGNTTLTGDSNVGVGQVALEDLTSGSGNVAIGSGAGRNLTSGGQNMCLGSLSLMTATTANFNTSVGTSSLNLLTTGVNNVAIGYISGQSVTTGSYNVLIGQNSADSYTSSESSNIIISNSGSIGESNKIRIGTTGSGNGQQNKCFIAGIRGVTTDINDAVAVLIDSAGQLGTTSSSARYKKNIEDLGSMSEDIYNLRPVSFDYKNSSSPFKSVGLIAEEVEEIIPWLVVYDKQTQQAETVRYNDLVPLLLNELIKLNKRVKELEKANK